MNIAEKLQTVAENQQAVYNAGNEKGLEVARSIVHGTIAEFDDDKVTYIAGHLFYQSYGLTSLNVPAVQQVGYHACYQCTLLKTVNLPNVIGINNYAFQSCTILNNLNISSVKAIGQYAFSGCRALKNIYIPKCVQLENSAFNGCSALQKVDMTAQKDANYNAAPYIKPTAFANCSALATLIIRINEVVTLDNVSALGNTPIANGSGRIFVPRSMVSAYKAATNWSTYADYILAIEDYPSITKR